MTEHGDDPTLCDGFAVMLAAKVTSAPLTATVITAASRARRGSDTAKAERAARATPAISRNFSEMPIHWWDGRDGSLEDLEDDQDALAPDVLERKPSGRGIHIRVSGGNPAGTADYPDGLRWIQTIDTNAPLFGQSPPYVDFIPPRDDKPFYFSDAGETATFSDNPSRSKNNVRWDAILSLTGVRGRTITRIDSVKYGFDIDASGNLSLHAATAIGVNDLVIQGDTLRSEHPDWSFSGGFAVPQVPAGGTTGGTATA